jgi:hypothetical protein
MSRVERYPHELRVWVDGGKPTKATIEGVKFVPADALEAAEKALRCVTALLQAERDCLVECSTTPPAHDLATLDPLAKEDVEEMDAALETARAALSKLRGTE